jgi:hypothetical protein
MLSKMLLTCLTLTASSPVLANILDLNVAVRHGEVNDVDWKGTEFGFAYLFDLNDVVALGPYLTSTRWDIQNDRLEVKSKGDHREFGPEIRFTAPLETLDFMAGASYSIFSKGTVETEGGRTADLALRGLRFKIGLGLPLEGGSSLNMFVIKGLQDLEVEANDDKVEAELDELAFAISLSF